MPRIFLFLILLFIQKNCSGQEGDSIYLYNGQVLTGTLKEAKQGIITIDDRDLKYVNVKIYKIKHLSATHSIFRVETHAKKIYYTPLIGSSRPGSINIRDGDSTLSMHLSEIAFLVSLEKNFFERLDGNFGLGFSFAKSNSIGQFNVNSTVNCNTKKMLYQLNSSALYSIDSSRFSRDNESVQLFCSYNLNSSWFAALQLYYQRNIELSISRRFQEMIGAGNKIILKRNYQLWALSGLSIGQEKSTQGSQIVTLEVPVILKFSFFKYQDINLQLFTTHSTYISLSQPGRFRYEGTVNYMHELVNNFNLGINVYCNYDNQPPAQNSSTYDYGTVLSVSYKF